MDNPLIRDYAPRVQHPRPDDINGQLLIVIGRNPQEPSWKRGPHYVIHEDGEIHQQLHHSDMSDKVWMARTRFRQWNTHTLNEIALYVEHRHNTFAAWRSLAWLLQHRLFARGAAWDWVRDTTMLEDQSWCPPLMYAMVEGNRWSRALLWGRKAPWGTTPLHERWESALTYGAYLGEALAPVIMRPNGSMVLVCADAILEWRKETGARPLGDIMGGVRHVEA